MNILQLVPSLNIGGVEKGTVEIARALTSKGHKAVVVSSGGKLVKKLRACGAKHYVLPIGKKNPAIMVLCYFKLRKILRKEQIDIVHARSRIPALTGYFASRKEGVTFITTAHGQYKKHLISGVMGWGKVVIVANEMMARYMRENFSVPDEKIRIVPRGVDIDKFTYLPPAKREKDAFVIGMISRFTPIKGHIDFLRAFSKVRRHIPGAKGIMMGDIDSAKPEYLTKIKLTMTHLSLGDSMTIKDSGEKVEDVLDTLNVFVSANMSQEAFGRSVIEAQAKGVPVVATRVGGVAENIHDGVTGLLAEPENYEDIADKILKISNDKHLRESIAENARKNVEEKYTAKKMSDLTLDIYSKILEVKKILVFKISSFGDVILIIPTLRSLRSRYPGAVIKVLVDVKFRKILQRCPYVDEIITCDFSGRDRGTGFFRLAGEMRAENFNISIDMQNNRKSHFLSFLAAIPGRYGYDNGKWSFFLNRRIPVPKNEMGPVEHQLNLLKSLGITSIDKTLELWTDNESDERIAAILRSNWLRQGQKLAGICLSASPSWKTKNWGIENFVSLADMLAKKGIRSILIGSSHDSKYADIFQKKSSAMAINAVGMTDIPEFISLVKRCNVLVSGDSSPIHVAAAVATPFVAIFGPTSPERHMPYSKKSVLIRKNITCSPCYKKRCKKGHICMENIKPKEVFDKLMGIIR